MSRILLAIAARRRERKLSARIKDAGTVVMSGHTKSGRTWLRVMISSIYHHMYGINQSIIINYDNFNRIDSRVPSIHFGGVHVFDKKGKIKASRSPQKPILVLIRDPRDVAVSFFHHVKWRASDLELYRKAIPKEARDMSLAEFLMSRHGIRRTLLFTERALREASVRNCKLIVRYEDLRKDPEHWLRCVIRAVDSNSVPDSVLQKAVSFASFEQMRKLEQSAFFAGDRIGATDPGNPNSAKVREGASGRYADALGSAEIAEINSIMKSTEHVSRYYFG